MANRRMLSKEVIGCDDYYTLSPEAKALYPFLVVWADDDGFLKTVKAPCRTAGLPTSAIDELTEAGFLIAFTQSGPYAISDWEAQNHVQASKHTPTVYQDELSKLEISEEGRYLLSRQHADGTPSTCRQGSGSMPIQDKEGEEREVESNPDQSNPDQASAVQDSAGVDDGENRCSPLLDEPVRFTKCCFCGKEIPVDGDGIATCRDCRKMYPA